MYQILSIAIFGRTCLRKLLSVLGRLVDLLAPKSVASTTHPLKTVHVHEKLFIKGQSSEVRLYLVKWISLYEGCPKNAETGDIIQIVKETGRWNLCHKGFK